MAAAALRLYRLHYGYAHAVVGYDDGVYFGSSLELTRGNLPYRDFVLVHPPVIALVFAPIAFLAKLIGTAQAMGLAKILTALVGAASVPLTAKLVWHRGLPVVALASVIVAVQGDAVVSGTGILLEPWVALFTLLGAALVFRGDQVAGRRRVWWGGVVFGIALATKIWAIAPLLAIALVCRPVRTRLRSLLGGTAVGFAVPVLPFALMAPWTFVHEVFVVQVFRSDGARTSVAYRLVHLFGVAPPDGQLPTRGQGLLVTLAIVLVAGIVVAWARVWRRTSPVERFAALGALLIVIMLFIPGAFYWHYTAFAVPFLAMAATMPLTRLRFRVAAAWGTLVTLVAAGLLVWIVVRSALGYSMADDHRQLDAAVPEGACVVTTEATFTIAADRYLADDPDCPAIVDSFGSVLQDADGRSPSVATLHSAVLVHRWLEAYRHADFVYLVRRDTSTVPDTAVLRQYLRTHFHLLDVPGLHGPLYARN